MGEFSLEEYLATKPWGGLDPDLLAKTEHAGFDGRGKLNIYVCRSCCGHIVTRDVDHGVTPFLTSCLATPGCEGMMQSSMYRVFDQKMRASHLWYRPGPNAEFSGGIRDHLKKGGLILRPAEPGEGV